MNSQVVMNLEFTVYNSGSRYVKGKSCPCA